MTVTRLAIIGAGPYATYAVERLAATVSAARHAPAFELHVFEKTGEFGAGQVHSARQSKTSALNRIAAEVSFAADESVVGAGPLLPKELRPTLYEWCARKFRETGNSMFDIAPRSWPKRYLHGLALADAFRRYIALLRSHPSVRVDLHADEVVDIADVGGKLRICTRGGDSEQLVVEHVLVLTGHSYENTVPSPAGSARLESNAPPVTAYVAAPYPLEERLTEAVVPPGCVVGCAGTMLTAIDVILHLTEGRGGRFVSGPAGGLKYLPCGREPAAIIPFSESGLFGFARPLATGAGGGKPDGTFLNKAAVDRLREAFGVPLHVDGVLRRQIDYERHLLPLIVLEMAHVYYSTLLGENFGRHLALAVAPTYEAFLGTLAGTSDSSVAVSALLAAVESSVEPVGRAIDAISSGVESLASAGRDQRRWCLSSALRRYLTVVFGAEVAERASAGDGAGLRLDQLLSDLQPRAGHTKNFDGNRFSWQSTLQPIPRSAWVSPEAYRNAMIEFMRVDCAWGTRGVPTNPAKAAADYVWRGLRPIVVYAVNEGGLQAASHRKFLNTWLRQHNRLAYGAPPEVMEKILRLIECRLVDASLGPEASVVTFPEGLSISGAWTKAERRIDVLVNARVPSFDATGDVSPLFPNLVRRGLVRKWSNPSADGNTSFQPGGLDLSDDFHPLREGTGVDRRLTFLGPSIEGKKFFQGGAMKPGVNHHCMRSIAWWCKQFWEQAVAASLPTDGLGIEPPAAPAGIVAGRPNADDDTANADVAIHRLVEAQVRQRPAACAVRDCRSGVSLRYDELWNLAGALAAELTRREIGRGSSVAVALDRSLEMTVALLAISRLGAQYVSIDPDAPLLRVAALLEDSGAACVIVPVSPVPRALPNGLELVPVSLVDLRSKATPADIPDVAMGSDEPLYIGFTSGTSGRAKGVVVPHRAVRNLVINPRYCTVLPGDRVGNAANPAFDATTFEIWAPLTAGATVVILPSMQNVSARHWIEILETEHITSLFLTTSLFHILAREHPRAFRSLRTLLIGGEPLDINLARRVLGDEPPQRLVNVYGPTETTTFASYYDCTSDSLRGLERVPIGYAIQETRLYLLDERLNPVSPGERAELYIAGPGVGHGYVGRPDLTDSRFLAAPAHAGTEWRLYRTGDTARQLVSGALELLGRNDRQIKMRGFRIELEEIELAAVASGLVDVAIVEKVNEGPSAALVGFALPASTQQPRHTRASLMAALNDELAARLPRYMIPLRWILLDQLPLGPTGKVDRNALLALDEAADSPLPGQLGQLGPQDTVRAVQPFDGEDPVTACVQRAWCDVLGVERACRSDNFIDHGGNSILAIQLSSRVAEALGVECEPSDVLLATDLAELLNDVRGKHAPLSRAQASAPAARDATSTVHRDSGQRVQT